MKTKTNNSSVYFIRIKNSLFFFLTFITFTSLFMLQSCGPYLDEDETEEEETTNTTEPSDFAAKWIVNSDTKSAEIDSPTLITFQQSNNETTEESPITNHKKKLNINTLSTTSGKNLTFALWEGWSKSIIISNKKYDSDEYDDITDDEITTENTAYCNFSFTNDGSKDITNDFYFSIYVDGEIYKEKKFEGGDVESGDLWVWGGVSLGNLDAGTHTIKVVLDSEDDITETDETDNEYTKTIEVTSEDNNNDTDKNLAFNLWEGWSESIVISNQKYASGEFDDISDDDITSDETAYCNFSFTNDGSEKITNEFYVYIYVDGELYTKDIFDDGDVLAGYSYVWGGFSLGNLDTGSHTIKVVLDAKDAIDETDETDNEYTKTIEVTSAADAYSSFEFLESRYIIAKTDGDYLYGKLTTNSDNSILYLDNFGTIDITSISDSKITFDLTTDDGSSTISFSATRSDEEEETDMISMLTLDVWILESTTGQDEVGEEWLFSKAGTYFFYNDGVYYNKYWSYRDEESFYFGTTTSTSDGVGYITNITDDEMDIEDDYYTYHFVRE